MENNLKHSIYLRESNIINEENEGGIFLNNTHEITK
jgi:hypothetical protein